MNILESIMSPLSLMTLTTLPNTGQAIGLVLIGGLMLAGLGLIIFAIKRRKKK